MQASQLKPYSLGLVAANKPLSSKVIEVTPIEDLPMTSGEITDNMETVSAAAQDTAGSAYQVEMTATATIKATWMPLGSPNRITAPDVRRGETVMIYQFADTDKFYWVTMKDDMKLRKLETVIFAFSATQKEADDADPDTTYFFEISTHKKLIHLHTSQANGEPYGYDIQLNTADGFFTIQDTMGNSFTLNTAEKQLLLSNSDGSFLNVIKKQIFASSPDLIDLKTKAINMHSETVEVTANTCDITAETTHNGNILLKGDLGMAAGPSGSGSATIDGNTTIKGPMNCEQVVTVEKLISIESIVAPNVT